MPSHLYHPASNLDENRARFRRKIRQAQLFQSFLRSNSPERDANARPASHFVAISAVQIEGHLRCNPHCLLFPAESAKVRQFFYSLMAERVGFEPTLEFPLNTLSKRAPSTTRPSLPRGIRQLECTISSLDKRSPQARQRPARVRSGAELKPFTSLPALRYSAFLPNSQENCRR